MIIDSVNVSQNMFCPRTFTPDFCPDFKCPAARTPCSVSREAILGIGSQFFQIQKNNF